MMNDSSKKVQSDRQGFKPRLVGLLVIIAIAVILIPIAIDFREQNESTSFRSGIPPKPNNLRVEILPVQAPQKLQLRRSGDQDSTAAENILHQAAKTVTQTPKSDQITDNELPLPTAWIIQVASFKNEKNAIALKDKLRQNGYPAFIETIAASDGPIVRVAVGPELVKKRAVKFRDVIKKQMDLNGLVIKYTVVN